MHLNEDDLVLHYYGEMPAAEESRAAAHLARVRRRARQNYTRLQRVMAFVDSAPAVEAAPGFERIAWARLEPALRGVAPRRLVVVVRVLAGAARVRGGRAPADRRGVHGRTADADDRRPAARPRRSRRRRCASGSCSWISATTSIDRRWCWWSS